MRRIKKQFKYTKVTATTMDGVEVLSKNYAGKVDESKVMKEYLADNDYQPLNIEMEEVVETRVMRGEFFLANSELLTDEADDEEDEE